MFTAVIFLMNCATWFVSRYLGDDATVATSGMTDSLMGSSGRSNVKEMSGARTGMPESVLCPDLGRRRGQGALGVLTLHGTGPRPQGLEGHRGAHREEGDTCGGKWSEESDGVRCRILRGKGGVKAGREEPRGPQRMNALYADV
jgi:hypothetical protein